MKPAVEIELLRLALRVANAVPQASDLFHAERMRFDIYVEQKH
jgi:hypothetical protein